MDPMTMAPSTKKEVSIARSARWTAEMGANSTMVAAANAARSSRTWCCRDDASGESGREESSGGRPTGGK